MALSLAQNAIAFLIDLAEKGEIDPWDVNVIDVIDRFLKRIREQPIVQSSQHDRSPYEQSLSESGQAFLYASMLVLLKADTLIRTEIAEADALEFEEDAFFEPDDSAPTELPRNLEHHIHRRAVAAPPEKRQVTLQELIGQLEMIAEAMADPKPKVRPVKAKPHTKQQAVRTIAQLAHQENLSEIAEALSTFLDQYWDDLEAAVNWIDFEQLITYWTQFRPDILGGPITGDLSEADYKHEKVGVFWGLLYLSAQSKVELDQKTFYQDLRVRHLKPSEGLESLESLTVDAYVLPD
jgi:segregation and condensation protein A